MMVDVFTGFGVGVMVGITLERIGGSPVAAAKQFLARESSTGRLYLLACRADSEADEPYRLFAREVYGLDTSGDFDTGNVDIDLFRLTPHTAGVVKLLQFPGGDR